MPRDKSRLRDKRSPSNGSTSSYDRKKSKSKHKRRSRSRDRSESSYKRRRSSSRSRHKRRSYSRSSSRSRYESKSRKRSTSRSRVKKSYRRSISREGSLSASSSRSRNKHSRSKHKSSRRRSHSSSSRSTSYEIEQPIVLKKINLDDTEVKIEKAIKAAAAAGLTMTKIPTYEYKSVEVKEEMPSILDRNLLDELNSESFVQKSFISSKNKKFSQNIVIDLNKETVKVPEIEARKDDSILNFDAIPNKEELREMWIKKLYQFRKKVLRDES